MPSLEPPLQLLTASESVGQVIRDWVRRSLGARALEAGELPFGTLLFRTEGSWDCIIAMAVHSERVLHPVIVFKNPVALWQCSRQPVQNGPVDRSTWTWLRRQILVHNPGLDGLLHEVEQRVIPDERPGR